MVKKNQQLLEETSADYERGNIQDFYDVSFDIDEDKKKQQKKNTSNIFLYKQSSFAHYSRLL